MASERLDSAEKIVRMVEWNETEPWEYNEAEEAASAGVAASQTGDGEGDGGDGGVGGGAENLAQAKRFLAAQSFLFSWQEGKVPTGWKRPRRLADFDGKYPQSVIESAEEIIADRIAVRNYKTTVMLKDVISARDRAAAQQEQELIEGTAAKRLSKIDVDALRTDFSKFNTDFFDVKSALSKATAATAEVSLQIQALSQALK